MTCEYLNSENKIAVIELKGRPYQQVRDGVEVDCTKILEELAINSKYEEVLTRNIAKNQENLTPLFEEGYYGIDRKIKKGISLNYAEAFSLMSFVSMGVNKLVHSKLHAHIKVGSTNSDTVLLQSIALLSCMSTKEGFVGLTAEEIAGLSAATLEIDTIIRIPAKSCVLGIGGMGGDKGYVRNGDNSKLFSLSTMGAIVMANFGYVHKHHSYPNTSKVAGQSAIEFFGALSNQSDPDSFTKIQDSVGLIMTSCHTTRLIHSLSHLLKGETINHVVGPISIPVDSKTPINAFIGVNDNIHPETMIRSLAILQEKGVQMYSSSIAFCGLNRSDILTDHFDPDRYYKNREARQSVAIDEVAPPPFKTLASFLVGGENRGTYVIDPEDFMDQKNLSKIDIKQLLIPNTEKDIVEANLQALTGRNISRALYLGMTGALALFVKEYAHKEDALDFESKRLNRLYLREAHQRVMEVINSGRGFQKLLDYVNITKCVV